MATCAYSQYEMHIFAYCHYLPPCYMSMRFNKGCYYSIYRLITQLPASLFLQVCHRLFLEKLCVGGCGVSTRVGGGGGILLLTVGKLKTKSSLHPEDLDIHKGNRQRKSFYY